MTKFGTRCLSVAVRGYFSTMMIDDGPLSHIIQYFIINFEPPSLGQCSEATQYLIGKEIAILGEGPNWVFITSW